MDKNTSYLKDKSTISTPKGKFAYFFLSKHSKYQNITECNIKNHLQNVLSKWHWSGGLHLGKGVQDNGYGQFLFMLGYKLEECGKHLIKVDRYFASSKICSVCGHKKKELALSDRMYVCECGNRMDRDVNAAVNIREEGKRIYKECA